MSCRFRHLVFGENPNRVHVEQGGSHKGVMTQWELLVIHCVCGGRIRTFFRLGCDSVTVFAAVVWFVS